MMPLAPTSVMTMPTSKPKIGFSIDSIVGNRNLTKSPNSECSETPLSPVSDYSYPSDYQHRHRSPKLPTSPAELNRSLRFPEDCSPLELQQRINRLHNNNNNNHKLSSPPPHSRTADIHRNIPRLPESPPISQQDNRINDYKSLSPLSSAQTRLSPDEHHIRRSSQTPSPEPHHHQTHPAQLQQQHHQQQLNSPPHPKAPIMVPGLPAGLIRPYPVAPGPPPPNGLDIKQLPPYMNPADLAQQQQHFLAAQFQAAAALAHAQQGFPTGAGLPPHAAHFNNPNVTRDSYPLYPWLMSRHGRIFPHRFPGSPDFSDFLLQPFRKPKRVRTAFSPSQLLKLEHAFESNHYVVGAERKTLAQALSLSETQVKVWFQNRRTKHKRVLQEEDGKEGSGDNSRSSPSNPNYEEDDELIDMDDCPSDEESDNV